MKIIGLITEYNPFHNGHKYHIEKAKEITCADYCIAIMSGDFVQRGAPAFLPKHLRAEMALQGGCDMILELPAYFATGSAEYFAFGAISILNNLGCIDAVCFGSECGDYKLLEKVANILAKEPEEYVDLLKSLLKKGYNYPNARQQALNEYLKDDSLSSILAQPNNILGIEYIKAMIMLNSSMQGYTIAREGSSYHDKELSIGLSSASAIRNQFSEDLEPDFQRLSEDLTDLNIQLLKKNFKSRYPVSIDDFSLLLRYKLLSETKESLTSYMDINSDLANRIINYRNEFITFSQFIDLLKTKELTYSRISRCLIHILLNIQKDTDYTDFYARVLGFRKDSSSLFSFIKKESSIPLITRLTDLDNSLYPSLLKQDIYASDLYENIISHKYKTPFINELTKQIVKY